MSDMPDIPEFLLVKNRKPITTVMTTKQSRSPRDRRRDKPKPWWMPKGGLEPAGIEIMKQQQAERRAKQKARLEDLKARKSR